MSNDVFIYRGHSDNVFAVAWSPDGKYIASASQDGTVRVWRGVMNHARTDDLVYRGHNTYLLSVAWSPDGQRIASGDTAGVVNVWDVWAGASPAPTLEGRGDPGGRPVTILSYHGHTRFVRSIAWSPDGRYIASGGDYGDSTVQVWEALTGHHLYTRSDQYRIFAVSWSPDGRQIASASFDGSAQVWDASVCSQTPVQSGSLFTYGGHTGPVYAVAWSPDGQYIASAGQDTTVRVWTTDNDTICTYHGHTGPVKALSWSPDSTAIASAGDDTTMQVFDILAGNPITVYHGHSAWVRTVAWSPDGKRIASASDHNVHVWRHVEPM